MKAVHGLLVFKAGRRSRNGKKVKEREKLGESGLLASSYHKSVMQIELRHCEQTFQDKKRMYIYFYLNQGNEEDWAHSP